VIREGEERGFQPTVFRSEEKKKERKRKEKVIALSVSQMKERLLRGGKEKRKKEDVLHSIFGPVY